MLNQTLPNLLPKVDEQPIKDYFSFANNITVVYLLVVLFCVVLIVKFQSFVITNEIEQKKKANISK